MLGTFLPDHSLLIQKEGDGSICKSSLRLSHSVIHDLVSRRPWLSRVHWRKFVTHLSETFPLFPYSYLDLVIDASLGLDHDKHKVKLCKESWLNRQISHRTYVPYLDLMTSREQETQLGYTYSINSLWSLLFNPSEILKVTSGMQKDPLQMARSETFGE